MMMTNRAILLIAGAALALPAQAALALPAQAALGQGHGHGDHQEKSEHKTAGAVNQMCPIGKEPISKKIPTITYKDHAVGFCCPGCDEAFLEWDEKRTDAFIAAAMKGQEPGQTEHGDHDEHEDQGEHDDGAGAEGQLSDPYPLPTCPVSGEKLGSMGDPVVKVYDGREVRFCCDGCISDFEEKRAHYFEKIDEQIVKNQMRYYPLETCVVSGEALEEDGEFIGINYVFGNRLVRLCCKGCAKDLKADPERYLKKLDEAVIGAQRERYPLDTCVVAGGELGAMGEPYENVFANRLVRFCCPRCEPKLEKDPAKYLSTLDEAWDPILGERDMGETDAHGDR